MLLKWFMFGFLIDDIIGIIIFGSFSLAVVSYLQLRRNQKLRAEVEKEFKLQQQRAELESHVKEFELRVSKLEESLKKQ